LHRQDYAVNLSRPSAQPDNAIPEDKDGKGGAPYAPKPKPSQMRRWIITGAALLGVAATLTLGVWQLQRAAYKNALAEQISQNNKLPVLENSAQTAIENIASANHSAATVAATHASWIHRNVRWQGVWLHEQTVFLDNRFMDGRAGFYAATPLQLQGSPALVWVQRGWVARDGQDRARLPVLPAPAGLVTVQGKVTQGISRIYELGQASAPASEHASTPASAPESARASQIRQNLPQLQDDLQRRLLPIAVLQTSPAVQVMAGQVGTDSQPPDGLRRDWPQADAGVAKHYGYAFQWFALCCLIIVLYVWFQIFTPRR
jgi:surfeit locus 1 family protein